MFSTTMKLRLKTRVDEHLRETYRVVVVGFRLKIGPKLKCIALR